MSEIVDVWYQLYGENGKPYLEVRPAIVSVEAGYFVAQLKDVIYEKNKPILPEKFVASFLKVYQRQVDQGSSSSSAPLEIVDLSNQQLLKGSTKVISLRNNEDFALIVVVPLEHLHQGIEI